MTNEDDRKLAQSDSDELLRRAYAVETQQDALDLYRDWADTYDEHLEDGLNYLAPEIMGRVFEEFVPDKSATILDIGCGTGLMGLALSAHGYANFDGLDLSPEMLQQARGKGVYGNLIKADLTATLEIGSASYDAAVSTGTFTHAHVGAEALDEIFRILRPGAVCALAINSDVWIENGFPLKIRELTGKGTMHVREIRPDRYFKGGDGVGRFCVFKKTA
ncbi:MAG: class I SAM-dependent methyltransferase [Pseudomonadota bacterium]